MNEWKIIAVDFDGTLCQDAYPNIGEPNLRLIALLQQLQRRGCKLILWTCRCGGLLEEAVAWCRQFQIQFDAVNENVEETIQTYGTDSRKIFADVYIDDKCCFPWQEVETYREEVEYGKNA